MISSRPRPFRVSKNLEARRSSDNTAFWDHRKRVQDVIERMELEYDKALLTLHPLGISVSAALYNQMIGSNVKIHSVWLLHIAWIAWILGIITTLGSFRTSIFANRTALDEHDIGQQASDKAGTPNLLTTIFNWSSGILFIAGVVLSALFLSRKI
jgi:hypothetical protein